MVDVIVSGKPLHALKVAKLRGCCREKELKQVERRKLI